CMRRGVKHVLVQWVGSSEMDATWEPLADFIKQYPDYQLEELLVEGEMLRGEFIMEGARQQVQVRLWLDKGSSMS
uniref:Chromo domain-containing protein n=1 Tax=Aegilops tauschii subsp. strangulata TaxID=200361 RepID=A0A453GD81_AEGTS